MKILHEDPIPPVRDAYGAALLRQLAEKGVSTTLAKDGKWVGILSAGRRRS